MLDLESFDAGLAVFMAHFPNLKFVDFNASAWYETVKTEMDEAMYLRAVKEVCKKPEWFPSDNFAGQVISAANKLGAADIAEARYKILKTPKLPPHDPLDGNEEYDAAMKEYAANRFGVNPEKAEAALRKMERMSKQSKEEG